MHNFTRIYKNKIKILMAYIYYNLWLFKILCITYEIQEKAPNQIKNES